jgi:hypothetical protein
MSDDQIKAATKLLKEYADDHGVTPTQVGPPARVGVWGSTHLWDRGFVWLSLTMC